MESQQIAIHSLPKWFDPQPDQRSESYNNFLVF